MKDKLTFHNHPLKNEIIERWGKGRTNKSISDWLNIEHPNVPLSVATLCKHYKRYKYNKDRLRAANEKETIKALKKKKHLPIEQILWETIIQCRKMKKSKEISVKDWQYLDQQLQSAVEKLIRIQDSTGDSKDISVVLAEIFSRLETEDEVELEQVTGITLTEEQKMKIIKEVDSEDKTK